MALRFKVRKGVNIKRVITKVVSYALVLYVGGLILTEVGSIVNGSTSPFYQGFTIIGWTVTNGQVTNTTTGTGLLTVVGIIAFASIVLEFVQFKM